MSAGDLPSHSSNQRVRDSPAPTEALEDTLLVAVKLKTLLLQPATSDLHLHPLSQQIQRRSDGQRHGHLQRSRTAFRHHLRDTAQGGQEHPHRSAVEVPVCFRGRARPVIAAAAAAQSSGQSSVVGRALRKQGPVRHGHEPFLEKYGGGRRRNVVASRQIFLSRDTENEQGRKNGPETQHSALCLDG